MSRGRCICCQCPLEADEKNLCNDCRGVYRHSARELGREQGEATLRRLHHLRQRAEAGLPLFEEGGERAKAN
jgi:hypothetical protein